MPTAIEQLGQFASELRLSDVPSDLVTKVKDQILDTIGVTLLGADVSVISPVREYVLKFGLPGKATLVGPPTRQLDAESAAMFNATASMATELDNHHVASAHPCSVVPACLAVGEETQATGAECLLAITVAYEITCRFALATTLSLSQDRHFVNSAVFNVFGSAAGAGVLLGLDQQRLTETIAIAGSHASGIGENHKFSTGRYHAGLPAANGIRSARLAELGLRGSPVFFEGQKGYWDAFSAHPKPELLTDDLDQLVGIMGLRLKHPFASIGNIAPQIEALRQIRTENSLDHTNIVEIRVGCDPMMYNATTGGPQFEDLHTVDDVTAGHFCTPLQLGIAAVRERNDWPTLLGLAESGFKDPDIRRIANLVKVERDAECAALFPEKWMTKVKVVTNDGRSYEERAFAMTEPNAEEKFRTILEPIIPASRIDAIVERVDAIEDVANIAEITKFLEIPAK